jgi:hypothetical protein
MKIMFCYQEYPKWLPGPNLIVQNAVEERRVRWEWARAEGREKANAAQRDRADARAIELAPEIALLRVNGASFRGIARALNERGVLSARGSLWGPGQILRLLRRAKNAVVTGGSVRDSLGSY